jgi:Family of unknown function (DUF5681)
VLPPKRKASDGRKNNKPPEQHQFKKGQSGNKKGRPKKDPTFLHLVEKELNSKHSISVGTRQIELPLKLLLVKQLLRIAMKGNTKALFFVLEMLDTIQKANAKKQTQSLRSRYRTEDIQNMTDDERTELYFKTLRQVNGEEDEDE